MSSLNMSFPSVVDTNPSTTVPSSIVNDLLTKILCWSVISLLSNARSALLRSLKRLPRRSVGVLTIFLKNTVFPSLDAFLITLTRILLNELITPFSASSLTALRFSSSSSRRYSLTISLSSASTSLNLSIVR